MIKFDLSPAIEPTVQSCLMQIQIQSIVPAFFNSIWRERMDIDENDMYTHLSHRMKSNKYTHQTIYRAQKHIH